MEKKPQNSDELPYARDIQQIGNAQFVNAFFRSKPSGSFIAVCTKSGDPDYGGWQARKATNEVKLPPENNNYFNISTFSSGGGNFNVKNENFTALNGLLMDDIGTKVSHEKCDGFKLSSLIETSPKNYQGFIFLSKPVTDIKLAERLIKALADAGYSDSGASGVSRWGRLPVGINGKTKYRSGGQPFQCRLIKWNPEIRYMVAEIIEILGLNLEENHATKAETIEPFSISNPAVNQLKQCGTTIERPIIEPNSKHLADIVKILMLLNPDICHPDWIRIGMAIFFTTGGSDDGLDLFNAWSSAGRKYRGRREIESKWRSFRLDVPNPVTIGTLIYIAKSNGIDTQDVLQEKFEPCETIVIEGGAK